MLSRVLGRFLDAYGYTNILCSIYVSKKNAILDTAEKSHLAAGQARPLVAGASTPNLRMLSRVLGRFLDAYGYINILCSIYVSKKNAILDTAEKSHLAAGQARPLVSHCFNPESRHALPGFGSFSRRLWIHQYIMQHICE